jgi:hypothetical protein
MIHLQQRCRHGVRSRLKLQKVGFWLWVSLFDVIFVDLPGFWWSNFPVAVMDD